MLRAIGGLLSGVTEKARRGIVRTPVEVVIGVATAMVLSYAVTDVSREAGDFAAQFGLAAVPTLIAVFATSALYELGVVGRKERWLLTGFYVVAGVLYGGFVLDVDRSAEFWRWGLLTSSLGLATVLTPLAARSRTLDSREMTWRFMLRLCIRLALAAAFTGILYVGLSIATLAVGNMFEVDIPGELYGHMAVWIFVAGGTWMIASGLADMTDRESPIASRVVGLIHKIGVWLALPLLGLYMLILYGYGLRLLVTGEAPSNLLSPLSLGAAMIGLIAMFFVEPLRRHGENTWLAEVFEKFPLAYIALLPMPAWAIWRRIAQHGWTEFRYVRLLAVGGLLVCFGYGAWRAVRGRSYSVTAMPACFAVLFFFASFGPWSALGVSKSSQLSRLQESLANPESSEESSTEEEPYGKRGSTRDWGKGAQSEAADRVEYLHGHFGAESLEPVLPEDAGAVDSVSEACDALDLACGTSSGPTRAHVSAEGPIRVPKAGRLFAVNYWGSGSNDDNSVSVSVDGSTATFRVEQGQSFTADLADEFAPEIEEDETGYVNVDLESDEATVRLSSEDGETAYFFVESLTLREERANEDWVVDSFNGKFLVPE